jgi:hypothetical protein
VGKGLRGLRVFSFFIVRVEVGWNRKILSECGLDVRLEFWGFGVLGLAYRGYWSWFYVSVFLVV